MLNTGTARRISIHLEHKMFESWNVFSPFGLEYRFSCPTQTWTLTFLVLLPASTQYTAGLQNASQMGINSQLTPEFCFLMVTQMNAENK